MRTLAPALAVCLLYAPARAQTPVTDAGSITQEVKSVAQQAAAYARQAQQLAQEVQTAETVVAQLNSFVQNPSLGAAMGLMQLAGLGSSIPVNPYSVQSIINGSGGIQGTFGSLSTLMNGSFTTNSIYQCTDNSWACTQQKQNAAGLAGSQGIGMNALQNLAAHIPILQALRDNLSTATTPAQRENALAALQSENAWATQEGTRLMAVNLMTTTENSVRDQRANEKLSQDFESTLARYGQ